MQGLNNRLYCRRDGHHRTMACPAYRSNETRCDGLQWRFDAVGGTAMDEPLRRDRGDLGKPGSFELHTRGLVRAGGGND